MGRLGLALLDLKNGKKSRKDPSVWGFAAGLFGLNGGLCL